MLHMSSDPNLLQEALASHGCGELGPQHLDGDRPVMLEVSPEIHRRYSAATEFTLDRVAPGEGGVQGGQRVGHRGGSESPS
jgi:hypothetical protein